MNGCNFEPHEIHEISISASDNPRSCPARTRQLGEITAGNSTMPEGENSVGRDLSTAGGKEGMTQRPSADRGTSVNDRDTGRAITPPPPSTPAPSPRFGASAAGSTQSGGTLFNPGVDDARKNEDEGEQKKEQGKEKETHERGFCQSK